MSRDRRERRDRAYVAANFASEAHAVEQALWVIRRYSATTEDERINAEHALAWLEAENEAAMKVIRAMKKPGAIRS